MTTADEASGAAGDVPGPAMPAPNPPPARKRHRTGLFGRLLVLALLMLLAGFAVTLSGKPIPLPVWAVAEVETRLNRSLAASLPEAAIALGGVDLTVDGTWKPLLRLEDVRLLKPGGEALLTLPELHLVLDGQALLSGKAKATSLRIVGARLSVLRDAEGRFDFSFGGGNFAPDIKSFSDLFDMTDTFLAAPAFQGLARIEAEAVSLLLTDQRSGRSFQVGDGRLSLENRTDALTGEVAMTLQGSAASPGRAVLTLLSAKGRKSARLEARIENIAARDLAAQAAVLSPLAILDAPISGQLAADLGADGIEALEAELAIGKGSLHPTEAAAPVAFDRAALAIAYDAAKGRVAMRRMEVDSPSLRARATGQAYLVGEAGQRLSGPLAGTLPRAFLTQISFQEVMIDPAGIFAEPVRFSAGALDVRLVLSPFQVEIGQLSLAEDSRRLTARGRIGADAEGWSAALDLTLNEIAHDRLIALWPQTLLAKTREWVGRNLLKGKVFDVDASLRLAPGYEPRLHLDYSFEEAEVRFLPTLPPVRNGLGYSTIDGTTYSLVMSRGQVTAPEGGEIDVAGSVFRVPDVTRRPARAEITLKTRSSLTAALSLLDQPPFNFMRKADRPVDLGTGTAEIETVLKLPLQKKIALSDVSYDVSGTIRDFRSDRLVAGRVIEAEVLAVTANPEGLAISGAGRLGVVAFDATFDQRFDAAHKGKSRISGELVLSQKVAEEFGLGLPSGMVTGSGAALVGIDLVKGQPGKLSLTSDLRSIGLSIPEVGWSKPAAASGRLDAEVTLGPVPKVSRLALRAAGLEATGSVTMRQGGGLDVARFDTVRLGDWLDGSVDLVGRGKGRAIEIAVTSGEVDLARMPSTQERRSSPSGQGSGPLSLNLDRLILSPTMALTGFRGDFSLKGGFSGGFGARMNGGAALRGTVVPGRHGTAARITAEDAGAVLRDAGLFSSARSGTLDLTLTPRAEAGQYDGRLRIDNVRVRNTSVLAELLNAVSIVGLLEQMNGSGLVFNVVDGEFLLTPNAVQISRGSAIGASLGVSMAGVYQSGNGQLAMQGVISPIYLLNGIGALLSKRGEGVFGFNYRLRGTAKDPDVDVNPLSILTPGLFREIFRTAPPVPGEGPPPPKKGRD